MRFVGFDESFDDLGIPRTANFDGDKVTRFIDESLLDNSMSTLTQCILKSVFLLERLDKVDRLFYFDFDALYLFQNA
jgi:hypothetical protein